MRGSVAVVVVAAVAAAAAAAEGREEHGVYGAGGGALLGCVAAAAPDAVEVCLAGIATAAPVPPAAPPAAAAPGEVDVAYGSPGAEDGAERDSELAGRGGLCNRDDENALLQQLFVAAGGPDWIEAWRPELLLAGRHCELYGIECLFGCVTGIDLAGNNLHGTLPEDLWTGMPVLGRISVASNFLEGPLIEVGGGGLEALFQDNLFSGPVPSSWALPLFADLSHNLLDGVLFGDEDDVEVRGYLNCDSNLLQGSIPTTWGSTSGFQCNSNVLSGGLPADPPQFLTVNENALTGTIPPYTTTDLFLEVSGNDMTGTVPFMPGMVFLNAGDTLLKGPLDLGNMPDLIAFLGTSTLFEQVIYEPLPRLEVLVLSSTGISGPVPDLTVYPAMTTVALDSNFLTGSLQPMPISMEEIFMYANMLTGSIDVLLDLPRLTDVNLAVNTFSSTLPPFSSVTNPVLEDMSLYFAQFYGEIPSSWSTLSRVGELGLSFLPLSGPLPDMSNWGQLLFLRVAESMITGTLPELPPSVVQIEIFETMLEGPLPSFADLPRLNSAVMYEALFTGSIPPLTNHPSLVFFDVGDNLLTGALPNCDNATELVSVNVAGNELSSEMFDPANVPQLRIIDVSLNSGIVGTVPPLLDVPQLTDIRAVGCSLFGGLPEEWIQKSDVIVQGFSDLRAFGSVDVQPALSVVDLSGNPLGASMDDFFLPLKALRSLRQVSCDQCSLHGNLDQLAEEFGRFDEVEEIVTFLDGFVNLLQLDLSLNEITGTLPAMLPDRLVLATLSSNQLEGPIALPWLRDLVFFDATDNRLQTDTGDTDWTAALVPTLSFTEFDSFRCPDLVSTTGFVQIDLTYTSFAHCECTLGYSGRFDNCTLCAADTYAAEFGQSECSACPAPASTIGEMGATSLEDCLCPTGYRQGVDAATLCTPCEAGTFGGQRGATECSECGPGTFSSAGATECVSCPDTGVVCEGGVARPLPGFWRAPDSGPISPDSAFYPCLPANACRVSSDGEEHVCAPGHKGVMCADCTGGRARFEGRCTECWPDAVSALIVALAILVFAGILAFLVQYAQRGVSGSGVIKLISTHVQCLLIVTRFGWSGPIVVSEAAQIVSTTSGSDFSAGLLFPLQCLIEISYHAEQGSILLAPLIMLGLAALFISTRGVLVGRSFQDSRRRIVSAAVVIMFLLHSSLMRSIASFFECSPIEGESRHVQDFSARCSGAVYTSLFVAEVFGVIMYVVGAPLYGLYIVRRLDLLGKLDKQSSRQRFGFLYLGYRRGRGGTEAQALDTPPVDHLELKYAPLRPFPCIYWEWVVILRKMLLVIVATFLGPRARGSHVDGLSESDQASFGVLILVIALAAHCVVLPFEQWQLNALEMTSLMALMATVLGGVAVGRDDVLIDTLTMLFNVGFLVGCVAHLGIRIARQRTNKVSTFDTGGGLAAEGTVEMGNVDAGGSGGSGVPEETS